MQLLLALNNSGSDDGVANIAGNVLHKDIEEHGVVVFRIFHQKGARKDYIDFTGTCFWKIRQHAAYSVDLVVGSRIFDRFDVCTVADVGHYTAAEVAFFVVVPECHYQVGNAKRNGILYELSNIHLLQLNRRLGFQLIFAAACNNRHHEDEWKTFF
jgi:hypothetical protein